jgi:hypothetical protein
MISSSESISSEEEAGEREGAAREGSEGSIRIRILEEIPEKGESEMEGLSREDLYSGRRAGRGRNKRKSESLGISTEITSRKIVLTGIRIGLRRLKRALCNNLSQFLYFNRDFIRITFDFSPKKQMFKYLTLFQILNHDFKFQSFLSVDRDS